MPTNKNPKQQGATGSDSTTIREISFRKAARKAPGTRLGTLQDWRGAGNNPEKISGRHGQSIRDGR